MDKDVLLVARLKSLAQALDCLLQLEAPPEELSTTSCRASDPLVLE